MQESNAGPVVRDEKNGGKRCAHRGQRVAAGTSQTMGLEPAPIGHHGEGSIELQFAELDVSAENMRVRLKPAVTAGRKLTRIEATDLVNRDYSTIGSMADFIVSSLGEITVEEVKTEFATPNTSLTLETP